MLAGGKGARVEGGGGEGVLDRLSEDVFSKERREDEGDISDEFRCFLDEARFDSIGRDSGTSVIGEGAFETDDCC